ncbi:MAG TPA: histidine phosphatase family protein [Planococcus sp. (in: firmicutes)]|nr:histidine phosphatase family protein [Planococcus sp. (in: firmicutes)]
MEHAFVLNLIRHFPTEGNVLKKYIGWTDEPILSLQVAPDPKIKEVWGSDLLRCRESAALLFPNAEYHENVDWRECNFGLWEERTYAQLEKNPEYRNWIDHPFEVTPPQGESLQAMALRIDKAVGALPEKESLTVITHGGPIRYLAARATGGAFWQQTALHGHCHRMVWESKRALEEGSLCTSFSVEPLMAKDDM